jgi:sRNA-binding regulator protein Hfq
MAFLAGLSDFLAKNYAHSTFEEAAHLEALYCLHLHGHTTLQAALIADKTYDITITAPDGSQQELPKITIKMLHPAELTDRVLPQITLDESVRSLGLGPITVARQRNFIKNKSLYTLMREQEPLVVTLLEGEILRGSIHSFSRYEIVLALQGGEQVVILRHAVHDIRNNQECSFLKASQQSLRHWTKSKLYIDPIPRSQLRPGLKKTKIKRRQKIIIR